MKAVRGGWVIPYSNRIPVVVVVCVRNLASPEVFESKLNCRFRKFESVLTVYSAGIAGCELNVPFRTLFVAGLAKISVEFRSELGSNAEIDCLIDYVPRKLIISSYTASRSGEPGGLVPHANDTDRARAAWSRQTTTAAFVELAVPHHAAPHHTAQRCTATHHATPRHARHLPVLLRPQPEVVF